MKFFMKNKILQLVLLLLFVLPQYNFGQNERKKLYRVYGTQTVMQRLKTSTNYQEKLNTIEKDVSDFKINGKYKNIRIPIVFHLLYNEQKDLKVEKEIFKQIELLNNDFGAGEKIKVKSKALVVEKFDKKMAKMDLEFCLAEGKGKIKGPGIIWKPVGSRIWNTANDMKSAKNGGSDPWDTDEYLNVWVCQMENDTAGYAQMPGGPAMTDGIVIDFDFFASIYYSKPPFNKGKTLSHLVGSYLGLYELWNEKTPCADDGVADTPIHNAPNHGPAEFYRHISLCDGNSVEMNMNIMDNSDDESVFLLTEGQKYRIQSVLSDKGLRKNLIKGNSNCGKNAVEFHATETREQTKPDNKIMVENTINIDIVPNPASNGISLKLISEILLQDEMTVIIYNESGKIVSNHKYVPSHGNEYQMDVSNMPNGKYFVAVKIGELQTSETLIIIK